MENEFYDNVILFIVAVMAFILYLISTLWGAEGLGLFFLFFSMTLVIFIIFDICKWIFGGKDDNH